MVEMKDYRYEAGRLSHPRCCARKRKRRNSRQDTDREGTMLCWLGPKKGSSRRLLEGALHSLAGKSKGHGFSTIARQSPQPSSASMLLSIDVPTFLTCPVSPPVP
jgi:hypothetical protein